MSGAPYNYDYILKYIIIGDQVSLKTFFSITFVKKKIFFSKNKNCKNHELFFSINFFSKKSKAYLCFQKIKIFFFKNSKKKINQKLFSFNELNHFFIKLFFFKKIIFQNQKLFFDNLLGRGKVVLTTSIYREEIYGRLSSHDRC